MRTIVRVLPRLVMLGVAGGALLVLPNAPRTRTPRCPIRRRHRRRRRSPRPDLPPVTTPPPITPPAPAPPPVPEAQPPPVPPTVPVPTPTAPTTPAIPGFTSVWRCPRPRHPGRRLSRRRRTSPAFPPRRASPGSTPGRVFGTVGPLPNVPDVPRRAGGLGAGCRVCRTSGAARPGDPPGRRARAQRRARAGGSRPRRRP